MSKKKLIVRILMRHALRDTWYDDRWGNYTGICSCEVEFEGEIDDIAKLHAKHVYSMINEALKKRRRVLSLQRLTLNNQPPTT